MAMNISCKFEKASYNIFFVRAVTVKSLYTLRRRRRRNKVKSIVSTRCYPVDTINELIHRGNGYFQRKSYILTPSDLMSDNRNFEKYIQILHKVDNKFTIN